MEEIRLRLLQNDDDDECSIYSVIKKGKDEKIYLNEARKTVHSLK